LDTNQYSIWIEAENWAEGQWDIYDVNTDIKVTCSDGTSWVATFYTFQNIYTLTEKNRKTGECLDGKYFWGSDMFLVDECSRNRIEEVIGHLIKNEEFERVFDKCMD